MDPLLNIVSVLAGSELDDTKVGQPVLVKWIFVNDLLNLRSALADGQDDSAITRNLSA